jgi:hypothetical protein
VFAERGSQTKPRFVWLPGAGLLPASRRLRFTRTTAFLAVFAERGSQTKPRFVWLPGAGLLPASR